MDRTNKIDSNIWVAREENGSLYLYWKEEPIKDSYGWCGVYDEASDEACCIQIPPHLFPDVKWEDEEPTEIELHFMAKGRKPEGSGNEKKTKVYQIMEKKSWRDYYGTEYGYKVLPEVYRNPPALPANCTRNEGGDSVDVEYSLIEKTLI